MSGSGADRQGKAGKLLDSMIQTSELWGSQWYRCCRGKVCDNQEGKKRDVVMLSVKALKRLFQTAMQLARETLCNGQS